jgi:8-oxo-dGTP pyrophosphatase MutT (NUDIX family)
MEKSPSRHKGQSESVLTTGSPPPSPSAPPPTMKKNHQHNQRQQQQQRYAGVLPYAVTPDNAGLVILLGKGHSQAGWSGSRKWSDFGGRVDEGEPSLKAAARECHEESAGLLGSAQEIEGWVKSRGTMMRVSGGATYLLPMHYDAALPDYFSRVVSHRLPKEYAENDEIAWVPLDAAAVAAATRGEVPGVGGRLRRALAESLKTILADPGNPLGQAVRQWLA